MYRKLAGAMMGAIVMGVMLYVPEAVAGYQMCGRTVVADNVSRCPDGSIPLYQSGSPPGPAPLPESRSTPRPAPAPAPSSRPSPFVAVAGDAARRIGLKCRDLHCETREGAQAGLTTLEISGTQPDYAGSSLVMVVGDLRTQQELERRKVGVFADGHYTASMALFRLPASEYAVAFLPPDAGDHFLGMAHFTLDGQTPAPRPEPKPDAHSHAALGTWHGTNVASSFTLRADGSYDSPNGASGRWRADGSNVMFTSGPLTAWNGGRATISDKGALEFYWTTAEGYKQYFAFVKRD